MELRFPHFTWSSETLIPIAGFKSHVYIVTPWATTIEIIQKDIFKNTVRCNHKKMLVTTEKQKMRNRGTRNKRNKTNNEMADLNPNISIIILNISGLNTSIKW